MSLKWVRGEFAGRKDDGTPIEYSGYVSGPFGIVRGGRRSRYYDLIHIPSGVSLVPKWLWLKTLQAAKAYAAEVHVEHVRCGVVFQPNTSEFASAVRAIAVRTKAKQDDAEYEAARVLRAAKVTEAK